MSGIKKIRIVTPLFNDWEALNLLLAQTVDIFKDLPFQLHFVVVNDRSSISTPRLVVPSGIKVEIIHLIRNIGHQRAIAVGLSHLAQSSEYDYAVVMDSDGEDKPEDILSLIEKAKSEGEKIIFAERQKRSESFSFKAFYLVYKLIFKILTGRVISFGNFSLIPQSMVKRIAFLSEIWNNYPGGIIRSRLPFSSVPINRGTRLAGESRMNFVSLILHGMSTISVFLDATAVRILLFVSIMISCSFIGSIVVLYLKFFAMAATPGWASSLILAFFIIFLQGFFISLFILFMVLNTRTNNNFIPLKGYEMFIEHIEYLNS